MTLIEETEALLGRAFLGRIDNGLDALGCVVLETDAGIILDVTDFENCSCFAHLVVGPDVEKAWREKNPEDQPYAREAFDGVLLSENAEFDGMSSRLDEWRNTPERWRMMFSVEPTLIRRINHDGDTRGFHNMIDLRGKNVTAKYIRIGRVEGIRRRWFFLDKILVYGKCWFCRNW